MRRLFWVGAIFAGLLIMLGPVVRLCTEAWWYDALGRYGVFTTTIWSQIGLGCAMGTGMSVIVGVNIFIALRSRSQDGIWVADNVFELNRGPKALSAGFTHRLAWGVMVMLTALAALEGTLHWKEWLLFRHGGLFGRVDPVFGLDYGFYVFRLPFIEYLNRWLFFALLASFFASGALHALVRSVQISPQRIFVASVVRRHMLALLAFIMANYGLHLHLSTYGLLRREGPLMCGASFTDLHATLPVLHLLTVLAALCVVAFLMNGVLRGWKLSAVLFAVLLGTEVVGLGVYPGAIQRFTVAPNELDKERPYLQANISGTRYAYGLEGLQQRDFSASDDLTAQSVQNNHATIDNVRLWDRDPLLRTYRQLQVIRTYYDFHDADNDRYRIGGRLQQISLSPRELSYAHLPSRNWINEHLTYTHGFGLCAGPVAKISAVGLPEFYVKNLPPEVSEKPLAITQPRVYYGEWSNDYVLVRTQSKEFDYPNGDQNVYTRYDGPTVRVGSPWGRLAFAMRFAEPKILLSADVTSDSGVLYHRSVRERASLVTPFIHYDDDPYMVVSKGRLYWILDGYTHANRLPYAQPSLLEGVEVNYVRNSVKTVIDAYTGDVQVFISDPDDPIVETCARIFPGVYRPLRELDTDLMAHIRYPQSMFILQSEVLSLYHMEDPQVFYNKEDVWRAPEQDSSTTFRPYYTILHVPEEAGKPAPTKAEDEFVLMTLFTPAKRQNMIAWMAARCDAPHYGQLILYKFPKQKLIYGPAQIDARINQDPEISRLVTLWNQQGSAVHWGTQLVIPVDHSLIYVKPLYIESTRSNAGLPQLQRVVVSYGDRVAMRETLDNAVAAAFSATQARGDQQPSGTTAPSETTSNVPAPGVPAHAPSQASLAEEARAHLSRAKQYQQQGNWAGYGEELRKLEETLNRMQALQNPQEEQRGANPR